MFTAEVFQIIVSVALVCLLMTLEYFFPRRKPTQSPLKRRIDNFSLLGLNVLLHRVLTAGLLVNTAIWASDHGIGLLNYLPWPALAELFFTLIVMDLSIYVQHRVMHVTPVLWRLHKVHHVDLDLDVSSGGRFHPGEIFFSLGWKFATVLLIGAQPVDVVIYETMLFGMAVFTHANLFLPLGLERALRGIVVTPDMHRIHHSVFQKETDSNYGNTLSIWDRIFRTYTHEPKGGQLKMKIGLKEAPRYEDTDLLSALILPFR